MTPTTTAPSLRSIGNRASTSRELMPDQLRGISLLGIILINIFCFSFGTFNGAEVEGAPDTVTKVLLQVFVYGKFFLLFSFLFGYSMNFIVGDGRPSRRQAARRRLFALGFLGVAHGALLFVWDILLGYAVMGAVLLFMTRFATRVLLAVAAACVALSVLTGVLSDVFLSDIGPDSLKPVYSGDFVVAHLFQLSAYPSVVMDESTSQWMLALAAMLVGLAAGRAHLLRDPKRWVSVAKRVVLIGAPVGFALVGLGLLIRYGIVSADMPQALDSAVKLCCTKVGAFIVAAVYVAAFGWAIAAGMRLPRFVTSAGRCSLTIYLAQSVVMVLLFAGWTLGLHAQVSAVATVGIACAIWLALAVGADIWLRTHSAGPMESLMALWVRAG